MPQQFIDVLRDEVKVVNRRREIVAAGRHAKNRGHEWPPSQAPRNGLLARWVAKPGSRPILEAI